MTPTGTAGISELEFSYTHPTNGKPITGHKTVYDPAILSDDIVMEHAQQAGQALWTQFLQNPSTKVADSVHGGINFRSYINFDKNGNAFVGNVHPIK